MLPVRRALPSLVVAALLVPAAARAGNGLHPRTPVEWPADTACMTVLDRGEQATLHLDYTILDEDTEVTADEVDDSRRHQFLAFCRDHSRQEPLPTWLSWKDVDAAAAKNLIDPLDITDEDVLETSSVWKDCWHRITADEARRPITFAEAMKGVDWDTTDLPVGPYVVQGYTWEPAFNIYSQRPGVVHVVDGPDLAAAPPAAALTNLDDYLFAADILTLRGCVRALEGSTLSLWWSSTSGAALDWKLYAEGVAFTGDAFELEFEAPPEAVMDTIALRVDVTDPMQRTTTAHMPRLIVVLPGASGESGSCETGGSFIGDPGCEATTGGDGTTTGGGLTTGGPLGGTGEGSTSASTGEGTSGGGPGTGEQEPGDKQSCACTSGRGDAGWAWGLVVLVGLGRRTRRGRTPR